MSDARIKDPRVIEQYVDPAVFPDRVIDGCLTVFLGRHVRDEVVELEPFLRGFFSNFL